jgi:hypothetical protein
MISNICKIEKNNNALYEILNESESVAVYAKLNKKQTLQLRLICEELYGMLPNVIDNYSGEFWIEYENNECRVNALINIPELTAEKKESLIKLASNKKNAFAVGIVGKIRSAIENLFLDKEYFNIYDMANLFNSGAEFSVGIVPTYSWSLNNYRKVVKKEDVADWDELEKSIIANLADDVIVGVKGRKANFIIVKKFA